MMARVSVAVLAVAVAGGAALAAEAPAGAASCSGCHAANAAIVTPVPRLEGRRAADIADAMMAFRAGTRMGTIMDRIAKGFSEEEIRALAAWYADRK